MTRATAAANGTTDNARVDSRVLLARALSIVTAPNLSPDARSGCSVSPGITASLREICRLCSMTLPGLARTVPQTNGCPDPAALVRQPHVRSANCGAIHRKRHPNARKRAWPVLQHWLMD